jgi:hypothetical protein
VTSESTSHVEAPRSRPDDLLFSRLARLVMLLAEIPHLPYRKPADIERLGIYDFFTDNPFLLFEEGAKQHRGLLLAGFDPQTFSYHSSSQRFTNRRARMQHDLSQLLTRGITRASADGGRVVYELTASGEDFNKRMNASYADSYRTSAQLVVRELNQLSDRKLRERVAQMLEARPFVIDLYRESASLEVEQ